MNKINKQGSLKGKSILLTRSQDQQIESSKLFISQGAKVFSMPSLLIGPPTELKPLDKALENINTYDWLIFSSGNGVKYVEERLQLIGKSLGNLPNNVKIAAVGKKTAYMLNQLNAKTNFVPPEFIADSLIKAFPENIFRLKVLIPRVQSGGRPILSRSFKEKGAYVTEVPAYESYCPEKIPEETISAIQKKEIDAITFTSSKATTNTAYLLEKHFGPKWLNKLNLVKIISIGPQTTKSCYKHFKKVDKEANTHDMDGILKACIDILTTIK